MIHDTEHPLAGQTVNLCATTSAPRGPGDDGSSARFRLEDWWDRVSPRNQTWADLASSNWACRNYAERRLTEDLPADDEVVYGKIGSLGYLVHVNEILPRDEPT